MTMTKIRMATPISLATVWALICGAYPNIFHEPITIFTMDLDSNIFIPKFRLGFDEITHELDTHRVLQHFHFHSLRADVFLRPLESFVFSDDDARNFVKQHRTAAHRTRRKRRIKCA